jgi:hypothetical protein
MREPDLGGRDMALDFRVLCPKIERIIDKVARAYRDTQGLILTEDDLKCILFQKLRALASLKRPVPTQDSHILATCVHAEVSWYGESQRLEIRPDITILDPEHLSILHRYRTPQKDSGAYLIHSPVWECCPPACL